jgi:anti-sigma28 factor (negative regulator of flagellin synthesis)
MKIERLSKLLNNFGSTSSATAAQSTNESNKAADEAVKIAAGFGNANSTEESAPTRARRVAELAEQVRAGTYKPDTTEVANAVARELFA